MKYIYLISIVLIISITPSCKEEQVVDRFESVIPENTTRNWIGAEYWANRLQDWQINNGRIECINGKKPMRALHLLSGYLSDTTGSFTLSVKTGAISNKSKHDKDSWAGFLIGGGKLSDDYRKRALIYNKPVKNGGIIIGVNGRGKIIMLDNANKWTKFPFSLAEEMICPKYSTDGFELKIAFEYIDEEVGYLIDITVHDPVSGELQSTVKAKFPKIERLAGNIALVANNGIDNRGKSYWFKNWNIAGSKFKLDKSLSYGPFMAVQYTLNKNIMKMTAQLPPIAKNDPQKVYIQIAPKGTNNWGGYKSTQIIVPAYTATFKDTSWNSQLDFDYKLTYSIPDINGIPVKYHYKGTINHDPVEKDELVVATFTGNNIGKLEELWFPNANITRNITYHNPDLLVFMGNQIYENQPEEADWSSPNNLKLDYLYKWYLWCWSYGELSRNTPTICIPGSHDVYHSNIWGNEGRKAPDTPENEKYPKRYKDKKIIWSQDQGGYRMPADIVNMIQRTQTSHLPDPFDPTPVEQGIGVYYTSLTYGRVSFCILEDKKFKSPPSILLPEARVVNGVSQIRYLTPDKLINTRAKLLGNRQLDFIRQWAANWNGADIKVSLSQSIFTNLATYPDNLLTAAEPKKLKPLPQGTIPYGYNPAKDMKSNAWPQNGRNKALRELRKGFAFMIGGGQNLGSVIHHGVDTWNDAGYSFGIPSIANTGQQQWLPQFPGNNRKKGMPRYTGQFLDGFGNNITVLAASNPYISDVEPVDLNSQISGYGIVRFNKKSREITMECWPSYTNHAKADAKQYPGWPVTVSVDDNYNRKRRGLLPYIKIRGLNHSAVIQVVDEKKNEIVYTVRIKGDKYRPIVFRRSTYSIIVSVPEMGKSKTFRNVKQVRKKDKKTLIANFND